MENIQSSFAKYLGKNIWDEENEEKVILIGVAIDCITYLNSYDEKCKGKYEQFKILVKDTSDALENSIPTEIAVVEISKIEFVQPLEITPESFLEEIKKMVYEPIGLTDEIMWKNRKCRKMIYKEARQIIMASYFCTFEHSVFTVSQAKAAAIYGLDHATTINSIKVVNELLDTNIAFREKYKDVFKKVYFINPKSRLNLDVLNFDARSLIKDLVKQIKRILKSGSDEDILEIKNCINN